MPDTNSDFLKLLRDSFDESELRDICFHLNIDYESLRGQGKKAKALALLEYCFRTKHEQELVTLCRKLRPRQEWPELTKKAVRSDSSETSSSQDSKSNKLRTKWLGLPVWAWGPILLGIIVVPLIAINLKNLNRLSPTPEATQQIPSSIQTSTPTPTETAVSPTPAITNSPTSTPTPDPTSIYSPSLETITVDNADNLEDLEQLGAWFANRAISYSPDGQYIAVGTISGVYIHDTKNLTDTKYIPTTGRVSTVAFSPSGKYIAYSVDGDLHVHDFQTESQDKYVSNSIGSISQLIFTQDDILIVGSNKEVNFWEPEDDFFLQQPIAITNKVTELAVSTDQQLLAIGSDDGAVQFWFIGQCLKNQDTPCLQLQTSLTQLESRITGLAFLPGEHLLAASAEKSPEINLWDFSDCSEEKSICGQPFGTGILPLSGQGQTTLTSLDFSPDGQLLAAGSGSGYLEFWDVDIEQTEWHTNTVDLHGASIIKLKFSPVDQIIAAEESAGAIRLLSLNDSSLLDAIYDHVWIANMAISRDSMYVLTGSWGNVVRLLSLAEKEYIQTWGETNGYVQAVGLSYDERLAAAHSGNNIWIWQVGSSYPTAYIGNNIGTISSLAFSPTEEKLVAGTESGKWYLWNSFSDEANQLFASKESPITTPISSIAFSSDGQTIATGHQDGSIQLWDAVNGDWLSDKPKAHTEQITSIIFSNNDEWLASGTDDGNIKIWVIHDNKLEELQTLTEHEEAITSLSFSPDSLLLASASQDNALRLWQVENGAPLHVYHHKYADINGVTFSVDGTFIISAGSDGVVHIWGKNR